VDKYEVLDKELDRLHDVVCRGLRSRAVRRRAQKQLTNIHNQLINEIKIDCKASNKK
jgi:hypothetical protein